MKDTWKCPNDCDAAEHPYPFFAPACCLTGNDGEHPEMGIYVNGEFLSNMRLDGVQLRAGEFEWDDCLPHCSVCGEEAEWEKKP